jgi:ribonucleoside-diphosphate reductase alpha chain
LDELATEITADMTGMVPDYAILSGRIAASNIRKITPDEFSEAMDRLYNFHAIEGKHTPMVSKEVYELSQKHKEVFNKMIDFERDDNFTIHAIQTLKKSYLLKCGKVIIENPQFMWLRVSLGIHGNDLENVKKMYDAMSTFQYIHSSPTLFNSGTPTPQMASCFLIDMVDDSIEGIYDTLKECALISKSAGGVGINVHKIRSNDSYICGTNGVSSGIVKMLQLYDKTFEYVNQGGKRKGSCAVYLSPDHADFMDFMKIREPGGSEEMRARGLFTAAWLPDLFMKRVENNEMWSFFDPNTARGLSTVYDEDDNGEYTKLYTELEKNGKAMGKVPAVDVWYAILESQTKTGTPYLLSKDQSNRMSNQKNIGVIKSSNLCVAPETMILTDAGYQPIALLQDQDVTVWNGFEWSQTTVRKTGENQKLIKVVLSNGSEIECTEYHKFYVETGSRPAQYSKPKKFDAKDLTIGMKLIKFDLPGVENMENGLSDFPYAYTSGFYSGDGVEQKTSYGPHEFFPRITLYCEKKDLIPHLEFRTSSFKETAAGTINLYLYHDIPKKFTVPSNHSNKSKLEWFAGLCDSDGTVARNGSNESIQIGSIHKSFLVETMLMLQTLGVHSKVTNSHDGGETLLPDGKGGKKLYNCKPIYRLLVNSNATKKLLDLGFTTHRLRFSNKTPQRDANRFITVQAIVDEERYDDTFCFTEPKRNMGMFNGILAGNCAEILEVSTPEETAVCNLASINLSKVVNNGKVDFNALADTASNVVYNLNKVIDGSYYPTEKSQRSNVRHRPLGLGVSGFQDMFFKLQIAFDSDEAKIVNKRVFEAIYYGAVKKSVELAKEHGYYETFPGSPASQGIFNFDMYDVKPDPYLGFDWESLREDMMNFGLRNSLLVALMPTASSATIMNVKECFEAQTSNIYTRNVLSGEFIVSNQYLARDLEAINMWNKSTVNQIIADDGSVQNLSTDENKERLEEIKKIYKTVWEQSMKTVIDMAADRQAFVDQSQSMNLHLSDPDYGTLSSMYFYAWKKGLKTLCYYLRMHAKSDAMKFTVDDDEICVSCQS